MKQINLYPAHISLREAAQHLATAFPLSIVDLPPSTVPFLHLTSQRLELRTGWQRNALTIYVDFIAGALGYRRFHDTGRHQPLGRAIGLKPQFTTPFVLEDEL